MEESITKDQKEMSNEYLPMAAFLEKQFELHPMDLRTFSPLTLAYIGDAVYEIIIRTVLIHDGNAPVNKLHKRASNLVKASAQKDVFHKIEDMLTEEELTVFKRGRNSKSYTSAKNASITDYRIATGLEALVGYLYLSNQMERLAELIKKGIEKNEV